ncbi:hypothetical protein BVX93_01770 [bacterium B13(2017)]|nr:hypothetical protein BVX93_01770 [bacterium B13(2017)]
MKRNEQKNCIICGRFFRPDPRVKDRQKSCKRNQCQRLRKKKSQESWFLKNKDYFQDRYDYVKTWREKHPNYQQQWRKRQREIQDEIPTLTPLKTITLVVPGKIFKGEIQDEIRLVHQCGCGMWLTGYERKIQDQIAT